MELSREQLTDLLLGVTADGSFPDVVLMERPPAPDMKPVKEALTKANDAIRKSLPNSRYGSGRDAFYYRHCATHVVGFKKLITDGAKTLETAGDWPTVLRCCVLAWSIVEESIVWDDPGHNAWRNVVEKNLMRLALKAAKGMIKDPTVGRARLERVVEKYSAHYPHIQPPLDAAIAQRKF